MRKVTTIMLGRDHVDYTLRAVRALIPELRAVGGDLVLVDQASQDGTAERVTELARDRIDLRLLRNSENETYSVAANRAAAGTDSEFLLFLDNDTEIQPGALNTLIAACDGNERVAAAGPKLLYPTGQIQEAGLAMPLWLVPFGIGTNAPGGDHRFNFPRAAFALSSSCLLVRGPAFATVGGFDERYVWGCESTDLALAFHQRKWAVLYEPRAVTIHHAGATINDFPTLTQTDGNRKRLLERWGISLLRQVATYLDQLAGDGPCRFFIFGTGESGQHLANTLEIGGYEVAGFLSGSGSRAVGSYPVWGVREAPAEEWRRVLIGSPYVREAEDTLATAGLLAGAALPILLA